MRGIEFITGHVIFKLRYSQIYLLKTPTITIFKMFFFSFLGCKDIYHANIDCQWIDVSELELGTYTFKMSINPEYKVAEKTFTNNAVQCVLVYTQQYASIYNCTLTEPEM